jgi:hypothetical protein
MSHLNYMLRFDPGDSAPRTSGIRNQLFARHEFQVRRHSRFRRQGSTPSCSHQDSFQFS